MEIVHSSNSVTGRASERHRLQTHNDNNDDLETEAIAPLTVASNQKESSYNNNHLENKKERRSDNARVEQQIDVPKMKPAMPRAKRVISFDDQTSRLSRGKLVIV
jgi:hypothetical protein